MKFDLYGLYLVKSTTGRLSIVYNFYPIENDGDLDLGTSSIRYASGGGVDKAYLEWLVLIGTDISRGPLES